MFIPAPTSTGTTSHPCPKSTHIPASLVLPPLPLFAPLEPLPVEELPLPAPAEPTEEPPDPELPDELPPVDPELPDELPPLELPELPPELPELPPLDPALLPSELHPELPPLKPPEEPPPLEPPGAARTVRANNRVQSTANAPTDENFMISYCLRSEVENPELRPTIPWAKSDLGAFDRYVANCEGLIQQEGNTGEEYETCGWVPFPIRPPGSIPFLQSAVSLIAASPPQRSSLSASKPPQHTT